MTSFAQRGGRAWRAVKNVATDPTYRRARRARTLLRRLHLLNGSVRMVALEDDGGWTLVHANDAVLSPWVVAVGHFQRDDFNRALELVQKECPTRRGKVFVDVGANVGTTTLYALRNPGFDRAISIEPGPDNLRVLRANLVLNDLVDAVAVVPAACGSERSKAQLLVSASSQADHRLARGDASVAGHEPGLEVDVVTLDEALADAEIHPEDIGLLWIDTQGHEPAVLGGAARTLAAAPPTVMEFWPSEYTADGSLEELVQTLSTAFDRFVDLSRPSDPFLGLSELRPVINRLVDSGQQTDLLLLPRALAGGTPG